MDEADTVESVDTKIATMVEAQRKFSSFTQEQVDQIFEHVAHSASKRRTHLARMAVAETKMGCFEDKVIKNAVACELTLSKYRDAKTVGIIEHDDQKKLTKIAVPNGPIAAILPTTNPTSTVLSKALFALKTRNSMLILPHPRASECTAEAVRICHDAAVEAGAPPGILQVIRHPSRAVSSYAMHHPDIRMLLATGGPAMVKACYASGKPALGVGAGNASVVVDETANLHEVVGSTVQSKTFDNGVICASEQSVVMVNAVYDKGMQLFKQRGVCVLEGEDKQKLSDYLIVNGHINPDIVGQSATTIAERIGVNVPPGTVVLGAEISEIGPQEPLSYEKLSPVLSFYRAENFDHALDIGRRIVEFGGLGHSSVIYTQDRSRLEKFAMTIPAFHLMANMPTALGAIGTSFNFNVDPSLTLGVGSVGGSSLSGSLTPFHLLDIKTLAEKQEHMEWYKNPPALYFNRNCTEEALNDLVEKHEGLSRALIVTDKMMSELGHVQMLRKMLEQRGFFVDVFDDINPDPDMDCVRAGVKVCESHRPDVMVCLGGGSPLDAGKFIRVLYENPEVSIRDLSARFVELRKRTQAFPDAGNKIHHLVCIPTTSGTASEVTPFSVITDDDGMKQPLFSYKMTPDLAIVDSQYTDKLPRSLVANAGLDAITHAVEAYVSVAANDFTSPHALRATRMLFENLEASYLTGAPEAREQVHHAATIAGLAFSNSFLGVCHSLSHKLGAKFHLPHGMTNAVLLPYVIEYNSALNPTRMGIYPSYSSPHALTKYAELAKIIKCEGTSELELTLAFAKRFQQLAKTLGVPASFQEAGVSEQELLSNLSEIAEEAFDDQCSPANPRFPLAKELEQVLLNAYYGAELKFESATED
eukprot:CAMPEP_0174966754 /NCGR_PEP_ID=MMETSP0004_2-20121128/7206_1 /TAXON_ID=420556 /ORGANISM="Ochromonas sp., Strain CCMP1393" /LENGTH=871 /DNA_ID=CAMNT_0016215815 /DNA_START=175 /DNA_END=2790 /DNA_ORIENTATION=-